MTGIILLAAGQSARMGTPKQQLAYNNSTLLEHSIATAAGSNATVVIVVLGFDADRLQPANSNDKVFFIVNKDWASGMGSSVSTGMKWLLEHHPAITAVLVMLCDQPFVTLSLLNEIINAKAFADKDIVACAYAGTTGVPTLFGQSYFAALAALQGETGARKILKQHADDVSVVPFPGGAIDIDRPTDYNNLMQGLVFVD